MSILNWLSRSAGARVNESDPDARMQMAIELAVLGIDARLRLVKGYAGRLLPAVANALAYCAALAAAIPGPIDLLPDAWGRDAGLRALFVHSTEIAELRKTLAAPLHVDFVASAPDAGSGPAQI
ncbi:MAG: hypothetical protein ACTS6J_00340 [Burkholderiales bacterium]